MRSFTLIETRSLLPAAVFVHHHQYRDRQQTRLRIEMASRCLREMSLETTGCQILYVPTLQWK